MSPVHSTELGLFRALELLRRTSNPRHSGSAGGDVIRAVRGEVNDSSSVKAIIKHTGLYIGCAAHTHMHAHIHTLCPLKIPRKSIHFPESMALSLLQAFNSSRCHYPLACKVSSRVTTEATSLSFVCLHVELQFQLHFWSQSRGEQYVLHRVKSTDHLKLSN